MHYKVSDKFFNTASALIAIALDDENTIEYDIAVSLIRDITTEEY